MADPNLTLRFLGHTTPYRVPTSKGFPLDQWVITKTYRLFANSMQEKRQFVLCGIATPPRVSPLKL